MADSETKPEDVLVPGAFKPSPPGTTEITIQRKGVPVTLLVNEKGKFVHKPKPMPEAKDVTRLMRRLLIELEAGEDGRVTSKSKNRLRRMLDNMIDIATADSHTIMFDKKGNAITVRDAKMAMASVKAFEALMARAYGKVSPGDDEMDAMKLAGIKIVVVTPPDNLKPMEDTQKNLRPSFIEAEIVENKK